MHQKIRNSLLRVVAVFLAFLILFPQIAGLTMPAFAAGSIIKKLEDNPFDGLRWATKQPISGYHGSYPTEIMGVTIDGVNYVAYCLNHDRYGSGDSPSIGEYGVKVYELDDPALQSNEEFINDKNILMYMQGVLASGGYTGGGDSAATALRTRGSSRQLFNNRFEAYGITKFAMWTLSVGQSDASKWSVNPTATYDASRNQYLLESLNQIMGSANNWKDFVDNNIYAVLKSGSDGDVWQKGPGEGEHYVEWEVTTGYFGNGKVQDSEHELAHSKLHESREESRETREIEAESVAYMIADHFGLDTSDYSFPYIASWGRSLKPEELLEIISGISNAAKTILYSLEEYQALEDPSHAAPQKIISEQEQLDKLDSISPVFDQENRNQIQEEMNR